MTRNRHQEITEAREILQLQEKAHLETIKSNYRRLLSKWHPDRRREDQKICKEMTFAEDNAVWTPQQCYDDWFRKNPFTYEAGRDLTWRFLPLPSTCGMEVGVGSGKSAALLGIRIGLEPASQMAKKAARQGIQINRLLKMPGGQKWKYCSSSPRMTVKPSSTPCASQM